MDMRSPSESKAPAHPHHQLSGHEGGSSQPVSLHDCNCLGDCGRTASHFALVPPIPAAFVSVSRDVVPVQPIRPEITAASHRLPFATGPPSVPPFLI
jgi:hypothetical protein